MTVFEYIIITTTRHDYRASGTSHEDAMRAFVADPVITMGYHEGDYEAEDGESFIVIGPTQAEPKSNTIKRLIAQQRRSFTFRTPEQIAAEDEMQRTVKSFLRANDADAMAQVTAKDGSVPPHPKVAEASTLRVDMERGLWVNDKRIPWSAVEGIALAEV